MSVTKSPRVWDLSQVQDDVLAVFVQKLDDREAVRELMLRYHERVRRYVARLARRVRLPVDELPDAEQNGVLAIEKAGIAYDVLQRCSFASFLNMVVRAGFYNEGTRVRRRRRERGLPHGSAGLEEVAEAAGAGESPWLAGEARDPAVAAEQHEWREHLQEVLGQLEDKHRRVWDGLSAGKTLQVIAWELHVSLRTVKRWHKELNRRLKRALGE